MYKLAHAPQINQLI